MNIIERIIHLTYRMARSIKRRSYVSNAKLHGLTIGENTKLVGSHDFGSEPYLISIGKNCLVTDGVKFITHDGSIQVPMILLGERVEDVYSKKSTFGKIRICDNVFLGVNTIILPETTISKNSIVAAGSIVKGHFPENSVIAGNPAKIICTTQEYYEKNKARIIHIKKTKEPRDELIKKLLDKK